MEVLVLVASIVLAGTLAGLGFLVMLAWLAAQFDHDNSE